MAEEEQEFDCESNYEVNFDDLDYVNMTLSHHWDATSRYGRYVCAGLPFTYGVVAIGVVNTVCERK